MTEEKRSRPRLELKQTVSVSDEESLALVEVLDLNQEGISFLAEKEFKKDSTVYFIFPGTGGLHENEAEARIWRSEATEYPALPYKMAAVFVDANMTYLEDVAKMLKV